MIATIEVFVIILAGFLVVQALLALGVVRVLRKRPSEWLPDDKCPRVAVVLCLRGTDPFLEKSVRGVLNQEYPLYDVHIVVDSRDDPAWEVVRRCSGETTALSVQVRELTDRRETCTLKCSSLVQVVTDLVESHEIIAFLDADTLPHPGWLRQLVSPLAESDDVGATTGNRWYMPGDAGWGGLVRYLWNAAAFVQMYWLKIPWGGTLALKSSVIRKAGLLEAWSKAWCEDTMLYDALRRVGYRISFVPSLVMINRETCTMRGLFFWIRRQLTAARLYHPRWWFVVAHGYSTALALGVACGLVFFAVASGRREVILWGVGGVTGYFSVLALLLIFLEFSVRRIASERNEPTRRFSPAIVAKILPAMVLTQLFYPVVLASAMMLRSAEWRGIIYRVDGPWCVRLVEYRPFSHGEKEMTTKNSL